MPFNQKHTLSFLKNIKPFISNTLDLLSDQQKAMLITFFISASLIMLVFNLNVIRHEDFLSESYYEMNPEELLTEEEIKLLEALDKFNAKKAETNSAFNESKNNNHFTQAYKSIPPPEDYKQEEYTNIEDSTDASKENHESLKKEEIQDDEISTFDKVNELLEKQEERANIKNSNVSYKLKNRRGRIPIPVYLCEVNGQVVVNINVNSLGTVTETKIDKSLSSSNMCLIEQAIKYAQHAKFNRDFSKPSQSGSITFNFIGKH